MPRLVDHELGQFSLGIWDFCWSIVSYLHMSSLGIGSSINRYVARFRAAKDYESLSDSVSSVAVVQIGIAAFIAFATAAFVWFIPVNFAERLGPEVSAAQSVVGLLGGALAVQQLFDSSRGVMTGCHRWDLHNMVNVGSQFVASLGMIAVLLGGGGLEGMAWSYFVVTIGAELFRFRLARRVCPELQFDLRRATWSRAKEMATFGLKTVLLAGPGIVLAQTTSLLVVSTLGPAALAVIARPGALVRHTAIFVDKFGFVLTPTVGSLQQLGDEEELRRFLLNSTRICVAFTLPVVAMLAINGDLILQYWMGASYADHTVIAILAGVYFLYGGQSPVLRVMTGMNLHGRVGVAGLITVALGLAIGIAIINRIGWSLPAAALLATVPMAISNGLVIPWMSCRKLKLSYLRYLRFAFGMPLLLGSVFVGILLVGRELPGSHLLNSIVALGCGALWLAGSYWRFLLSSRMRERLLHELLPRLGALAGARR
jgi:O-antigen/teichoic acid export membrane protein